MPIHDERFDVTLDVDDCRRCHGTHESISAKKFINPPNVLLKDPYSNRRDPTHWTMCPVTGEPILLFTKRGRQ